MLARADKCGVCNGRRGSTSTQGPSWGYSKVNFDRFFLGNVGDSRQMLTKTSTNVHRIPPRRAFCGGLHGSALVCTGLHWTAMACRPFREKIMALLFMAACVLYTYRTIHMYACIHIYIHVHIHVCLSMYVYIYIKIYSRPKLVLTMTPWESNGGHFHPEAPYTLLRTDLGLCNPNP